MKPFLTARVVPLLVAPFIIQCGSAGYEGAEDIGELEQALCAASALSRSSASASSQESASFPASSAIDGNTGTRWSSAFSDPQWLEVDLGAERWVNRVRLNWETAASSNYDIQVRSTTTAPWTTIYTDAAGNGGVDDITGLGSKARYVRMYSRARTTGYGNSLWELEVFGDGNPNCNTPTGTLIPARIEAESYGSFFDTTSTNQGGACAADAVDKQLTTDTGGGCNVGWTEAGEWLQYAVRTDQAQTLNFTARLAAASSGKTIHLELDGANIGTLTAPSAGWQNWADRTIRNVAVAAGNHTLRVVFDNGGVNFNWLDVNPQALQSVSLSPSGDATVASATPTTKLGKQSTLESGNSSSDGSRWIYFKFDISRLTDISSARLALRGHQEQSSSADVGATLYAVSSTSWDESTIDWNTRPAVGSSLVSNAVHPGADDYYRWDVSSYVRNERAAGRTTVSFALKNSATSDTKLVFNASETAYSGGMVPPELVITTKDAPSKAPSHDLVDSFVQTPAAQALYQIPVVVIRFLPTRDGVTLSPVEMGHTHLGPVDPALTDMVTRIDRMDKQLKFGVEEGSRFRGYANAAAKPSLGYKIVDVITVYEELPDGSDSGSGMMLPDYAAILNRFNLKDYVENRGVKQFWIWAGYMGRHTSNESLMVSKFGAEWDADNGNQDPGRPLPRLNKTYFIFHYAFMGPLANALHNHGHQYEAAYGFTSLWRHGTPDRFFVDYCGVNAALQKFMPGRAGDVHHPFNVNDAQAYEYDHTDQTVDTDIEDWKPQGGTKKSMNASRWMNLPYAWPDGIAPAPAGSYDLAHAQWQIYWAQNFPGRGNRIQNAAGQYMTNWFRFLGDWDGSFGTSLGLFGATPDAN
jgi:hypothetical protein